MNVQLPWRNRIIDVSTFTVWLNSTIEIQLILKCLPEVSFIMIFKLYLENNKTRATLLYEELQGFGF
jgi:hypothetical protein